MSRLHWLAAMLLRGSHAEFVKHDLDDMYARDRARGMSAWRADRRYARHVFDSAFSMWRGDLDWPGVECLQEIRGGTILQDLRFALRLFRKHPAPVGIAIGGLGMAIGVVTSVFTIVNATMLRPYGMDDPKSVVSVVRPGHATWVGWPYAQFLQMREGTTLAGIEAASPDRVWFSQGPASVGASRRPIRFVSGGYLRRFGGRPALGRSLEPVDDTPNAPPVIVISHYFWKAELNADPSVVGKTVWVNEVPVTMVGVLQPGFTGPATEPHAIWATFAAVDDVRMGPPVTATSSLSVQVTARLSAGASLPAVQENLTAIVNQLNTAGPARPSARRTVQVYSAASPIDGPAETDMLVALAIVLGIVGLVLALACTNTANLLMASAVTRMREVGVRLAMGATRGRLVRQMVTESLLLGLIAGGFGFLLAFWLVPIFGAAVEMPAGTMLIPDGRVLLFTVAVALVCGVGAGLSPARYGARGNVLAALQSQSDSRGAAVMPSRFRTSFVGFQAAVSTLLLVLATLLTRSAMQMTSVDIGFDADRLIGVSLDAPRSGFDEPAYVRMALAAVRAVPSVERASVSQYQPFGGSVEHDRFTRGGSSYELNVHRSDAEFFATTGVRILRGRAFTGDEAAAEAPVALISDSVARAFFQGRDPLGQSLSNLPSETGGPQEHATIIGVVAEALMTRVDGHRYGTVYRPIHQRRRNPPSLIIRTANPGSAARAVEDALRRLDVRVQPTTRIIREGLDNYLSGKRRLAWLLGPIALLALLLSAFGVYGMTAFVVGLRTAEVSVRMAIGASSADVLRLLVKDGVRPVIIGLGIGLGLALVASRVAAQELAGISPHDPPSIAFAILTLLAFALIAVVVPARHASTMDPASVLRRV